MIVILICVAILLLWLFVFRKFKVPKHGNMSCVTGGIKSGKSTLTIYMAIKCWKKQVFKTRIVNLFIRISNIFRREKKSLIEKPLFYCNIPLTIPYVPITQALLERRERFVFGSVAYIGEFSLVADSMSHKDMILNERLLLLFKLWAHETHGGYVFLDTQSIMDNHYAVKRCLNNYFYIHHNVKIPFFILMYVREMIFSEDGTSVNAFNEDVEDSLKVVIVPKRIWKMFDRYCYSVLTDDLPVNSKVVDTPVDLKAREIVSFKKYKTLEVNNGERNE